MPESPNIRHLPKFDTTTAWATLRDGVDWQQRSIRVFGKVYAQPRLTCWYGDVPYRYSGLELGSNPMPSWLTELTQRVSSEVGVTFNCVLCNLYRDGQDTVGWHADDESLFGPDPIVASLSYGATRTFQVRSREKPSVRQAWQLQARDLLVMGSGVQTAYQHRVPRTPKTEIVGPRINLTFRTTV